jgi:hypothetical protein
MLDNSVESKRSRLQGWLSTTVRESLELCRGRCSMTKKSSTCGPLPYGRHSLLPDLNQNSTDSNVRSIHSDTESRPFCAAKIAAGWKDSLRTLRQPIRLANYVFSSGASVRLRKNAS